MNILHNTYLRKAYINFDLDLEMYTLFIDMFYDIIFVCIKFCTQKFRFKAFLQQNNSVALREAPRYYFNCINIQIDGRQLDMQNVLCRYLIQGPGQVSESHISPPPP